MKYTIFIVVFVTTILIPLKTFAATKEKTLKVVFDCPAAKSLTVRPLIDTGLIYIFNQKWLSGNLLWNQLPYMQPEMEIKVLNWLGNKINLGFALRDIKTSKIYETPKYEVAMVEYDQTYVKRLNENLLKYSNETN